MADTNWGDEGTTEPKKKRVPSWVWFCGGGCLLMVIVAVIAGGILFTKAKAFMDPEQQWPKLAEIVPFTERPAELELQFGMDWGMGMYFLHDRRGYIHVLMRLPEQDKEESRRQLMDPSFAGSVFGFGGRKDARGGTIEVQGRELPVLRFYQMEGSGKPDGDTGAPPPGVPAQRAGVSIYVDLTRDSDSRPVIWQMTRTDGRDEPISDEEVVEVLKPFDVGTDR